MNTRMNYELNQYNTSKITKCSKKLPFSTSERELIVKLVRERPIIQDKRIHAKNIELKRKAWEELTVAFNSQKYVTKRNPVQLKRCWENIKCQRKRELSQESKNNMKMTLRGSPQNSFGTSENGVDATCTIIKLIVPGIIDTNAIEFSKELMSLTDDKTQDFTEKNQQETDLKGTNGKFEAIYIPCGELKGANVTTNGKEPDAEIGVKKKQCILMNIRHNKELHNLKVEREKIIIEREKNNLLYEKEIHMLQKQKLELEIEILKNKN